MGPVFLDPDGKKIGSSHISEGIVDGEILIRKEGEGRIICALKHLDFIRGVPGPDSDNLDLPLEIRILFNQLVKLLQPGSYRLAVGSVKAEDLNDDHLRLDLGDFEKSVT